MQRIMAKASKHGGIKTGMLMAQMGWVMCLLCLSSIIPSAALPAPHAEGIAPEQSLADGSVADNTTEWLDACTNECAVQDHAHAEQALQARNATTSHTYVPSCEGWQRDVFYVTCCLRVL